MILHQTHDIFHTKHSQIRNHMTRNFDRRHVRVQNTYIYTHEHSNTPRNRVIMTTDWDSCWFEMDCRIIPSVQRSIQLFHLPPPPPPPSRLPHIVYVRVWCVFRRPAVTSHKTKKPASKISSVNCWWWDFPGRYLCVVVVRVSRIWASEFLDGYLLRAIRLCQITIYILIQYYE